MKRIIAAVIAGALWFGPSPGAEARPQKEAPSPGAEARPQKEAPSPGAEAQADTLTVGAVPVPYGELLRLVKPDLAAQNIELVILEFADYEAPNSALLAGDIDASYFQHRRYLEANPAWKAALAPAFLTHIEPLGLYSRQAASTGGLKDGAVIAVPREPGSQARALAFLQARGLVSLKPGAGPEPALSDIGDNPKGFAFREAESSMLPQALEDADAAVMSGICAIEAGFRPLEDALAVEGGESLYGICVAVRKGGELDPRIKALEAALCSQKAKDYIVKTWNGGILALF